MPREDIEETSLQDDVRAAMEATPEVETPEVEAPPEPAREVEAQSDRDELGRFRPKGEKQEAKQEKAPVNEPPEEIINKAEAGKWSEDRPPSSWNPKVREKWAELPQEVRQEIIRREEAAVNGVRNLQERFAPAAQFLQSMEPIINEAKQYGVAPEVHILNVMATERILRSADVPTKFNALLSIADQYGIPLRDVINESVGANILQKPQQQAMQLPPELMQQINEIKEWKTQFETQSALNSVEQFGADKEFFHDVRNMMADYIERGLAHDLQSAYDMAVWANPDTREVMLNRRDSSVPAARVASRQAAAVGASIKPSGKVNVKVDDEPESTADIVRQAMYAQQSGRI